MIEVHPPEGSVVRFNYLCADTDYRWRWEDLVNIVLPSGNELDLGWYPQSDPEGEYTLQEVRSWDEEPIRVIHTRNLQVVLQAIQEWGSDGQV